MKTHLYDNAVVQMTEEERREISGYIEREFGIKMPECKKALLTGRLSKRLHSLRIKSFQDYFEFIKMPQNSAEYKTFIDLVSTHETSFFRESAHFDFMMDEALPALVQDGAGVSSQMNILSAACSTGEELYSAGIAVEEFVRAARIPNFRYALVGTDISGKVLSTTVRGVYRADVLEKVPSYAQRYFMRSKDPAKNSVRIVPEIRRHIECLEMNLLDSRYPFDCMFDIIFCRNVMIYFDRNVQAKVASSLCRYLNKGGYLLVGHSESLLGLDLPIEPVAPATYVLR